MPTPGSSFLGRDVELDEVDRLLSKTRLLTITGPGGAGKTRVALELARRAGMQGRFEDGVFGSFFTSLRDPSLVLPTLARTLSIQESPGQSAHDALVSRLRGKRSLILVDNLEHLLSSAHQLSGLVRECPDLTLLVTSRERLRVPGEHEYSLPPLHVDEGVELFCDRAGVEPSPAVAALVARLDGLPLAIELAAARSSVLSPEQLLARLSRRLDLLGSNREADPRRRTLRATIRWSYDLLSPEERELFAGLSVFVGGCTVDDAEAVCGASAGVLESLVDKSLVRRSDTELGPRYWMLETVRELAAEVAAGAGTVDALRRSHTRAFLRRAERLAHDRYGDATARERETFEADAANFRQALGATVELGDAGSSLRFVRFLGDYWYWSTGRAASLVLMRSGLELEGGELEDRAHALLHASRLAAQTGRRDEHVSLSVAAEAAFVRLGDLRNQVQVVQERATYATNAGELECAVRESRRALDLAFELRDPWSQRVTGEVHAMALVERAAAAGSIEPELVDRVRELFEPAVRAARADPTSIVSFGAIGNLAWSMLRLRRFQESLDLAQEAVRLPAWRDLPLDHSTLLFLNAAVVAAALGQHGESARLAAPAAHWFETSGEALQEGEQAELDAVAAVARAALGHDEYERAVREGSALTRDQAAELVLSLSASPG